MTSARQVRLSDGRWLGYDAHGPVRGTPVLYFHGTPSSRLEWAIAGSDELLEELQMRLIAIDRPGLGLSDPTPRRRFIDWPADIGELADHLRVERFSVLGYSGGTPYALACAQLLPERVEVAAAISCVAPYDAAGATESMNRSSYRFNVLNHDHPALGSAMQALSRIGLSRSPGRVIARMLPNIAQPDQTVISDPTTQRAFCVAALEALRQGPRGAQQDTALMAGPWGFGLTAIAVPVLLCHGADDITAPVAMARHLARAIPTAELEIIPREGHISVLIHQLRATLEAIVRHQ